jgi:hypothetical protein
MGFWSTLGKIALPVGAAIAAPFTGGSSLAGILGTAAKVGAAVAPVIGGAAKARGEAKRADELAQLSRDQLELQRARLAEQQAQERAQLGQALALQRAQWQAQRPTLELQNAVRAALLGSWEPYQPEWTTVGGRPVLQFRGGFNAGLPPEARAFAQQIMKETMVNRLRDLPEVELPPVTVPPIAPSPGPSALDRLLGIGATSAGLLGALDPWLTQWAQRGRDEQSPPPGPSDPRVWGRVRF